MNKATAAAIVCALSLAVACSSEDGAPPAFTNAAAGSNIVVSPQVVVAEKSFGADARVTADQVTVVTQGHEGDLAKLHAGSILVSRRSWTHPELNPYGFIRRVVSVTPRGADTVITTSPATLADAIESGSFDAVPVVETDDSSLAVRTLQVSPPTTVGVDISLPKDVTVFDSGTLAIQDHRRVQSASASIHLVDNAMHVSATPKLSGTFDRFSLTELHSSLAIGYDATSKLVVEAERGFAYSGEKKIFDHTIVNLIFLIGPIPVEVTLNVNVSAACEGFVEGKIDASTKWHASGSSTAGVDYVNGQFTSAGQPSDFNLESEPEVKVDAKAGLRCSLPVELDMLVYDAVGPFASVAPVAKLTLLEASTCSPLQPHLEIEVYKELSLGVKLDTFGYKRGWSWSKDSDPFQIWPKTSGTPQDEACPGAPNPPDCLTDAGCGVDKACSWNGSLKCCRTPAAADATKCLSDAECPSGQVCGWNLQHFVCQVPACN